MKLNFTPIEVEEQLNGMINRARIIFSWIPIAPIAVFLPVCIILTDYLDYCNDMDNLTSTEFFRGPFTLLYILRKERQAQIKGKAKGKGMCMVCVCPLYVQRTT